MNDPLSADHVIRYDANGTYAVCGDCGRTLGSAPGHAIGMHIGECAICGRTMPLGNAWHDYGLSDEAVEAMRFTPEEATE